VEDVLEELVGEIWDEYDIEIPEVIQIDKNTITVYSKMDIYDLNNRFNLDLPTEEFQTLGGFVFGQIGREPEINDEILAGDIIIKVESMDGHKILRTTLYRQEGFVDKHSAEE
ncbi:MAG: hemolysin, partial [Candidatus Aenigmarchaeota archaeon]|nr:hemolysin [Candidatus Aenigmarchaeota archaeon]